MKREAVEKFLMEKKKYEQSDMAEFWEWYLQVDPNLECTEGDLDALVSKKGSKINWDEINKIFEDIDRLFSDEKMDIILDDLEKNRPGYKEWYYGKINSWKTAID